MKYVVVDYETFFDSASGYTLRKMTPPEYICDPRWECYGAAVCVDDAPAVWMNEPTLQAFFDELDPKDVALISHNALFDGCITAWRFGFNPRLYVDTLGMARAMLGHELKSLSLASVAARLGLGVKGNATTKTDGVPITALIANPTLYNELARYAENDAALCRDIWRKLRPSFPTSELLVLDSVLRCAVDPQFVTDPNALATHLYEVRQEKENLLAKVMEMGASKSDLMSNDKFAALLQGLGVEPPRKTSKATGRETWAFARSDDEFIELLEHDDPSVQALVAARLGHKSTLAETRAQRFLDIANLTWPGKGQAKLMPMPLRYSGAHTHRLSGDWKLNCQNMPSRKDNTLRRALTAPKGKCVLAVDAAQIEARINAWISGQTDLVEAFREKRDIYSEFASEVFTRPVTKEDKEDRFVGKTCLAEGTMVLTERGYTPIQHVSINDRVWDGVEWVCHQGVVSNGLKKTLQLSGLWLTPDHLVWSGTQWLESQFLERDEGTLSRALAAAAENLPSQVISSASVAAHRTSSLDATAVIQNTRLRIITFALSKVRGVMSALRKHLLRNGIGNTPRLYRTTDTALDYLTGSLQRSLAATAPRAAYTNTTAVAGYPSTRSGGPIGPHSCGTSRHSTGGIPPHLRWTGLTPTATTSLATSGLCRVPTTYKTSVGSKTSRRRLPVYDVCSAGPRHRFTVLTDCGPILVHNCILGLGYQMGWPKFQGTLRAQSREFLGNEINLSDEMCATVVGGYRRKYWAIANSWNRLRELIPILAYGGKATFGPVEFSKQAILLPSGLRLHYHDLQLDADTNEWRYTYGGKPKKTYGGKLLENCVQALARVHVMDAAIRVSRRTGYRYALQLHDELVYLPTTQDVGILSAVVVEEMSRPPDWAPDLPLAAEAHSGRNYGECK